MKTAALLFAAVSLAVGGSAAFAGTKPTSPPPSECLTLSKLKATIKGAVFTPLNIGQMNYALGAYDASTPSHTPLPASDNALLATLKGKNLIIWMKAECASLTSPMPVGDEFAAHLKAIHATAGETSDATDDSQDMHL